MVTFLFSFLQLLSEALTMAILLGVILAWFSPRPNNVLVKILHLVTEPILAPLRRIIPRVGRFDFTPMVAIILIQLIYFLLP